MVTGDDEITDRFVYVPPNSSSYLESFDVIPESLVLGLQVLHAMLGLAQLGFQLSLQLPAALLELQQLLLGLLAAAGRTKRRRQTKSRKW